MRETDIHTSLDQLQGKGAQFRGCQQLVLEAVMQHRHGQEPGVYAASADLNGRNCGSAASAGAQEQPQELPRQGRHRVRRVG
jgi:hypothetical protein